MDTRSQMLIDQCYRLVTAALDRTRSEEERAEFVKEALDILKHLAQD